MKTYQGESGGVYEYFHQSRRRLSGSLDFLFQVTADRKSFFTVTVSLPDDSLRHCPRRLADNECYGLAKLALFHAFDQETLQREVRVSSEDAQRSMEVLGIEC